MTHHHDDLIDAASDEQLAKGLGWASIGIGLTEVLATKQVERWLGVGNGVNTGVIRAMGVREIMQGVDILSHDDPTPGVNARVAGDMLDGVLLGIAAKKTRNPTGFAAVLTAVGAIVALDVLFAYRLNRKRH